MKRRFDPRRILKFAVPALAFALVLFVAGSMAAPTFAAEAGTYVAGDYSVLSDILGVFTLIAEWISTAVLSLMPMFYVSGTGLTFLGVLAVAGLSFSVIFLMMGIIQRFLHFRG